MFVLHDKNVYCTVVNSFTSFQRLNGVDFTECGYFGFCLKTQKKGKYNEQVQKKSYSLEMLKPKVKNLYTFFSLKFQSNTFVVFGASGHNFKYSAKNFTRCHLVA